MKRTFGCILAMSAMLLGSQNTHAQDGTDIETPSTDVRKQEDDELQNNSYSKADWLGLNLGVGLSVTFDNGQDRRVASATLDENGIVRVDDEENSVARILLEGHFFFPCDIRHTWKSEAWLDEAANHTFWSDRCGIGPFIAVQPGEDEIIDAAAIGLMTGFKYSGNKGDTSSFNLGIGLVIDPNAQILGDGIEENQPLPDGETAVRFKEKQQYGWLLLTSFSF